MTTQAMWLPSVPPVPSGQQLTFRWQTNTGVMADNVAVYSGRKTYPHLEVARVTSYDEATFSSAWTDEYTNALVYLNVQSRRFAYQDNSVQHTGPGMYQTCLLYTSPSPRD